MNILKFKDTSFHIINRALKLNCLVCIKLGIPLGLKHSKTLLLANAVYLTGFYMDFFFLSPSYVLKPGALSE